MANAFPILYQTRFLLVSAALSIFGLDAFLQNILLALAKVWVRMLPSAALQINQD
jgi:hypothetical protein